MPVKCLIVDDEVPAVDLIKSHVGALPNMEVAGTCHSALQASEILKAKEIDLLFLDIQMPVFTGLDFLKTAKNLPKVILTTAHREYAVDGYDLDIVDYLLKPISFERFFKAVERYHQLISQQVSDPVLTPKHQVEDHLYVNINKKNHKVRLDSILYLESLKDYVRIHTREKPLVVKGNIGAMVELLPSDQFVRVHRSYVVSLNKITAYTAQDIEIGPVEIPIGLTYKEVLSRLL